MRHIDAAEDWLDSWTAGISARANQTAQLANGVAALEGAASSCGGSIRATVDASGLLTRLHLDDNVLRQMQGHELSRHIMATVHKAQTNLASQVAEQVKNTVGIDSETGRAVINSFTHRFKNEEATDDPRGEGR